MSRRSGQHVFELIQCYLTVFSKDDDVQQGHTNLYGLHV